MRAMLDYLEKVTLYPQDIGPDDAQRLYAAKVSKKAAQEALYVCFLFNLMDRLADAFDFHIPSEKVTRRAGRFLYTFGYGISSIPG